MWDRSLQRNFEWLEDRQDVHARGREFEVLVRRLFQRSHFAVKPNAGVASPRQTDLFARHDSDEYLVEIKWQKAVVDINDLDSLKARLARTTTQVTGVFFSMSGFSPSVIEEVRNHRDRIVLLFSEDEIRSLFAGGVNLLPLLRRKREGLIEDGQVVLDVDGRGWCHKPPDRAMLPQSDFTILDLNGRMLPWITHAGDFGKSVFVEQLPDVDWIDAQGSGVGFDLRLPLRRREDLACMLDILNGVGWTSPAGRWSIQQSGVNWHGAGAVSFLDAIATWESRYANTCSKLHHSEDATYFDVCDGGFYTVSATIGASHEGKIAYAHLSAQLVGVPVPAEPFRHLARTFDLDDQVYFRPLPQEPVRDLIQSTEMEVELHPVALLYRNLAVEDGNEQWITGLVVKNPFLGLIQRQILVNVVDYWPHALRNSELLVCELASWHQYGRPIDHYYLQSMNMARTKGVTVLNPVAQWEDLRELETVL